jgi:hypothetical protein
MRRIAPAVGLFFLAPLVAEFLLGNLPIKLLSALIVLAPLYGGGALLIRESVRRTGRGWPSILLLGMAYMLVEEGFATQSLFNPDYLLMKMHLLDAGYIPALGIGVWWTLFMFNLHAIWSIATPIALVEAAVPRRSGTPWLGRTGLIVTAVLFVVGATAIAILTIRKDPFVASHLQRAGAALIAIALALTALLMPRSAILRGRPSGWVPNPWLTGAFALVIGSAIMLVHQTWGWWAAAAMLALDLVALGAVLLWSRRAGWGPLHNLALAAGAALAYAWHAFVEVPVIGGATVGARLGNGIFALGILALIWFAATRTAQQQAREAAGNI